MPENSIYLLSNQRNARKTSYKERLWLDYLIETQNKDIKTEWNQPYGQKRVIKKYYPDGLEITKDKKQIAYEFLGCNIHYHAAFKNGEKVSVKEVNKLP